MRWDEEKSRRFQALRAAEARGPLRDAERGELSRLLDDLDADEADDLRSAMDRATARVGEMATQKAKLDRHADALASIVAEQQRLVADAATYLQRLRDRSAALAEDYRRLTGHDPAPAR